MPLVADCVKQSSESSDLSTNHTMCLDILHYLSETWGFIWRVGIAASFIILTENIDKTLGNGFEYFNCKPNQRPLICHFLLTSHFLCFLAWVLRWEEWTMCFSVGCDNFVLLCLGVLPECDMPTHIQYNILLSFIWGLFLLGWLLPNGLKVP